MADRKEICCIPDCDKEVRYVHLQVCAACYSGLARWRGRPLGEKRQRLEINRRLVSRMDFIIGNPKHHPKKKPRRDDLDHGDRKTARKNKRKKR